MYEANFHNQDISKLKFLVTGGSGFIGSNIVEYLISHGAGMVRVLDNFATSSVNNINPFLSSGRLEIIEGDIRDEAICHKACEGVDYITHQAALGSVPRSLKDPIATHSVNLTGFLNMLNAARLTGVKRFVFASSSSVYGDEMTLPKVEENIGNPLSPYAVTKQGNELYARVFSMNYGMEIIGMRYFNVFGPRQDPGGPYAAVIPLFTHKILKGEEVTIHGDGEQTRDFTFVVNAVQANIRAMFAPKPPDILPIYNIACGEKFSVNYMLDLIENQLGKKALRKHVEPRQGDIRQSLAKIEKATNDLGYAPTVNFETGLHKTIAYFLEKKQVIQ